ncbi:MULTISPECIES: RNA polymerase sigma factor [Olivibacter]|uniref:RNA polymerase sigma factor n=2 Tax=Olivibacter TaxID=376469 RepID=A0ABV6HF15_9SPHI|nr:MULTISPECIES: sigma-70 family RNA polymerase sigma factor [unclassified Olivibacter]MCL4641744.1 sigma-70 family RNA polymerase sigma factor [Olivibacter sp. UJ_SKK_5.1]MDM8177515.1 sigma-70 family RNA polymerase sigma factor [Olivibacter sp. 47]MDX3912233.1 sigma-70 family RNA polymerase sigma factor [Pseudosphingobacterium sp.]QEK99964.1 sigma-70 family RNA polymerase sigma factor [Olivibacter sp. LS-1]
MAFQKRVEKHNEADLLSRYKSTGELHILGVLYEPYMPLVYGVCLKYLKDEARSEDAVMQIFEQLIQKLRIHTVNNFKSWLYSFARNYCLMELRAANKETTISIEENSFMENELVEHQFLGEDMLESKLTQMEKCLEQLNMEQRECVRLFYLDQKCYKEISDLTGYDLSKVKSYIQNGKRNLKICMEKNDK